MDEDDDDDEEEEAGAEIDTAEAPKPRAGAATGAVLNADAGTAVDAGAVRPTCAEAMPNDGAMRCTRSIEVPLSTRSRLARGLGEDMWR